MALTKEQEASLARAQSRLNAEQSIMAGEAEPQSSGVAAGINSLAQGLSLGFSDEIEAFGRGAFSGITTPGSIEDRVEAGKAAASTSFANSKADRLRDRRLFPKTSIGSELVGGGVTGAGIFKALGASGLPLIPRVVGGGSAEGAAFGAGMADPGERGRGALFGAGIGAVGTPLAAGIGVSASSVLRPVARRLGDALFGTPKDRAIKEVVRALDGDDITINEAMTLLKAHGRNAVLPDLGDNSARLARSVYTGGGRGSEQARRFFDFRQLESQNQLRQTARRATGANDFDKGVIEVINNAESAAAPLYKEAYETVVDITQPILELLKRPAIVTARKKAAVLIRNEGFSDDIINDVTDVRYLDAIKRSLGDAESVAIRSGNGNQARVLGQLRRDFVVEIDAQVPSYAEARATFAGEAALRDAADVGRTIFKGAQTSVGDAAELIGKMEPSELQAARFGFLEWLEGTLDNQAVTRNTVVNKFSEVPKFRKMTQLLFPDQNAVDDFLRSAASLNRFGKTRNTVLGGSQTANKQADQAGLNPGFLRVASDAAFSQLNGITSALKLLNGNTAINKEVAEKIGDILFNPKIIPKDLRRGPSRLFEIPKASPAVTSGAFGGLVGSQQDEMLNGLRSVGLIGQ